MKFGGAVLDGHLVYEVLIEDGSGAHLVLFLYVLRSGLKDTLTDIVENGTEP